MDAIKSVWFEMLKKRGKRNYAKVIAITLSSKKRKVNLLYPCVAKKKKKNYLTQTHTHEKLMWLCNK